MFFNNKFNTFFGLNLTLVYTFPMCMTWRFHFPLRNYDFKCVIYSIIIGNSNAKQFSVTFCGDGTHVARRAGMCLMSFSVTSPGVRMSKAACHHAVAVVKGQESYTLYNTSFRNVFNSINALATSMCLEINDEEIAINVFLLMVVGMAGATSNDACIYGRVHSNDRGDMAKPENV